MAIVQLIDQAGNHWPVWLDTVTNKLNWGAANPVTTFSVRENDPNSDARMSIYAPHKNGQRASFTWYGGNNDGINGHVTATMGTELTASLGHRWGLGNSGLYCFVLVPATPEQFGLWGSGARYVGIGNWNDPSKSPMAELHVRGAFMADRIQFANGEGASPIDLMGLIENLQVQINALKSGAAAVGQCAVGEAG